MADWQLTGNRGDPWRVTIGGVPGGRAIRLHIGDVTVLLPPLEAHKLGSALHAASGLDDASHQDESSAGGARAAIREALDAEHAGEDDRDPFHEYLRRLTDESPAEGAGDG